MIKKEIKTEQSIDLLDEIYALIGAPKPVTAKNVSRVESKPIVAEATPDAVADENAVHIATSLLKFLGSLNITKVNYKKICQDVIADNHTDVDIKLLVDLLRDLTSDADSIKMIVRYMGMNLKKTHLARFSVLKMFEDLNADDLVDANKLLGVEETPPPEPAQPVQSVAPVTESTAIDRLVPSSKAAMDEFVTDCAGTAWNSFCDIVGDDVMLTEVQVELLESNIKSLLTKCFDINTIVPLIRTSG